MLKQQQGFSAIGLLFVLGFIIIISVPGMKIIPMYMNDLKITIALNNLGSDLAAQANMTSPAKIKNNLLDRFALQQMPEITADKISVTQSRNKYTIRINHQYRERIFQDYTFTLNINKSVEVPIILK